MAGFVLYRCVFWSIEVARKKGGAYVTQDLEAPTSYSSPEQVKYVTPMHFDVVLALNKKPILQVGWCQMDVYYDSLIV